MLPDLFPSPFEYKARTKQQRPCDVHARHGYTSPLFLRKRTKIHHGGERGGEGMEEATGREGDDRG